MNIISTPFELISRGGSSAVSGVLLLAVECLIVLLAILVIRRLAIFSGTKEVRVRGRAIRKYVIPERREWQGKAYVTVPEKKTLEIDVENHSMQFSPVPWKYERVREGDEIDVALQRSRFGGEIRILDIGPF
ncbi:hypothetical protein [Paraburkholderia dinghuensis]|uniref:Uncharacterized protein n=1 Tax=Paraburkholderia dinghuensis TaxID=2305225 RepID=A0A3N6NID5_9BURK|nr:hypothetical protein [Paraburkholderia dinghuensis]RQG98922.1 hypothetical protein D1Y85_26770 [Paraburkholderia dinghuensis]